MTIGNGANRNKKQKCIYLPNQISFLDGDYRYNSVNGFEEEIFYFCILEVFCFSAIIFTFTIISPTWVVHRVLLLLLLRLALLFHCQFTKIVNLFVIILF